MIGWDDLVALARELPECDEATSYGRPALKVRGRWFAALRTDPDSIIVKCDLEEKPLLLEARPDILFETPHNRGYGAMLIRLDAPLEDVRKFLFDSWLLAAPKTLARSLKLDQTGRPSEFTERGCRPRPRRSGRTRRGSRADLGEAGEEQGFRCDLRSS